MFTQNLIQKKKDTKIETTSVEEFTSSSNLIKDVKYLSKDAEGNEYVLYAAEGQVDISNSEIIFLTDLTATINLTEGNIVKITSDFGKYNINNYNTIFSKNVIITYTDNKITGDYVDFSANRNTMIISKNVIYTNQKNMLKADVIEIDIITKNTKIFMLEDKKKVNIKSIN